MIDSSKRKALYLMHQEGMSLREIARKMNLSRNTVREIIRKEGAVPESTRSDKRTLDPDLLLRLFRECNGFKQRVFEKLVEEEGIEVKYSTLTRMLRELGIGEAAKKRCDRVKDEPGMEMQHDTSPYQVTLSDQRVRVVASLLYLRYSKRRYLRFYRVFNRFTMKCFFHEALIFWGYAAKRCIIDNTNLARLSGTGANALIVPEMKHFARQYGFEFVCHEKGHANRKAGEERSFYTVETNFLSGRRFESLEDLNRQAFEWATCRMEQRPQTKTGLIPAQAFEHEKAYLEKLLPHLPAPYLVLERGTDQYGFAPCDGNYYFVPGEGREDVKVLKYSDRIEIYRGRVLLAEYALPPDGVKNQAFSPEGHPKARYSPKHRKKPTEQEEKKLRALGKEVGAYLDFALKPKGIERHQFVRKLFALSQQMHLSLFQKTLERALKYRITSFESVRSIALLYLNQGMETLPCVEVDESFKEREAYREGCLTDDPDFSSYEERMEEEQDG